MINETIRDLFPILNRTIYGKRLVYLDNGATTQKPKQVIERIVQSYENENSNVHRGVHYLSEISTEAHENARKKVADFINAVPEEIIFTRGTTESINLVSRSYIEGCCKAGDEIIFSTMEHHSNMVPWQMAAERCGLKFRAIPINDDGTLNLEAYKAMLNEKTRLVAITHTSNVLGTVNPIREISDAAHKVGAKVLVDAAQAIAHTKVDVVALGADFLAFSGHKMYAPTGIGVLWGKKELLEAMPPFMGGGEMIDHVTIEHTTYGALPYKFEAGTPNYVGSAALATAIDFINETGIDNIHKHEAELLHYATEKLKEIERVHIIGNAPDKSGIISFVADGAHHYDIGLMLDKMGIAVRTGHHCAEPIMARYGIPGTVRISFAVYNTIEEIDIFINALNRILNMLK
ncbi:MAG: cysteine desulfurase [Bacteroidales bacterium]|nr:cysteine desulfurase [Bacteroidales bacterium]MDY5194266.1 cysteine desulfurase [Candidatus Aphodosoma sp.]